MTAERDGKKGRTGTNWRRVLATLVCQAVCLLGWSGRLGDALASAQTATPAEGVADVSGSWDSNIEAGPTGQGKAVEITQSGRAFTWTFEGARYAGSIEGKRVTLKNPFSSDLGGTITQVEPSGRATRIQWDNGIVFVRKPGAAPAGGPPASMEQQTAGPPGWALEDMTDRPGMDFKVFWLDGSADDCMKACQSDPRCQAFTYFGPEQGPRARCYLKSGVPSPVKNMSVSAVRPAAQASAPAGAPPAVQPVPPVTAAPQPVLPATVAPQPPAAPPATSSLPAVSGSVPDVSGQWSSSVGAVYQITQSGSQFTWHAAVLDQKGSGTLAGQDLSASWSDATGSGSVKGKVSAVDPSGRATRIDWDNGVVFYR